METAEKRELVPELLKGFSKLFDSVAISGLYSMTRGESFILNYLLQHPESVTPGSISDAMKASTARTAAALRTLEAKGCILRTVDSADRRRVFVELTTVGVKKVEEMRKAVYEAVTELLDALGDDAQEFVRIISRLSTVDFCTHPKDGKGDPSST